MNPSTELDILIAEKVMGWRDLNLNGSGIPPNKETHEWYPRYSIYIKDAWHVIDRLIQKYDMELAKDYDEKLWTCLFRIESFEKGGGSRLDTYTAYGQSAPHAICLAALKAIGVNYTYEDDLKD